MPSVGICQSRLSDAHTEQSTRNRKTLSKVMASRLVASCSVLERHASTSYRLHLCFRYMTLSAAILLFPLLHALQGLHES